MRLFVITIYGYGLTERFAVQAADQTTAERDACRMFHVITNGITPEAVLT